MQGGAGLPVLVAVLATGSHAGVVRRLRHLEQAAAWNEVCQAAPAEPTG